MQDLCRVTSLVLSLSHQIRPSPLPASDTSPQCGKVSRHRISQASLSCAHAIWCSEGTLRPWSWRVVGRNRSIVNRRLATVCLDRRRQDRTSLSQHGTASFASGCLHRLQLYHSMGMHYSLISWYSPAIQLRLHVGMHDPTILIDALSGLLKWRSCSTRDVIAELEDHARDWG